MVHLMTPSSWLWRGKESKKINAGEQTLDAMIKFATSEGGRTKNANRRSAVGLILMLQMFSSSRYSVRLLEIIEHIIVHKSDDLVWFSSPWLTKCVDSWTCNSGHPHATTLKGKQKTMVPLPGSFLGNHYRETEPVSQVSPHEIQCFGALQCGMMHHFRFFLLNWKRVFDIVSK